MRSKRGISDNIVMILIIMAIFIIIIVAYFVYSLAAPQVVYLANQANGILQTTAVDTGNGNLSRSMNMTIGASVNALNNLEWMSYFLFIGLLIALIFLAFFVRSYPFLIVIWIVFIIIIAFCSIYFSVVYADLRNDGTLGAAYKDWQFNDFLLQNMPYLIVGFGMAGGIFLFVIVRTDDSEVAL